MSTIAWNDDPPEITSPKPNHDSKPENLIEKFVGETTMHGVSTVFTTKSRSKKAIWTVIMISATCASLFYITTRLSNYLSYTASSTSRDYYDNADQTMPFPAVTICNNNPFLLSRNRMRSVVISEVVGILLKLELRTDFQPPLSYYDTDDWYPDEARRRKQSTLHQGRGLEGVDKTVQCNAV